jgi:hypothetical protein
MGIIAEKVVTVYVDGTLTAANGLARVTMPCSGRITGVTAAVKTAPVGAALIFDINKSAASASTIFTTQADRPTIAVSTTATTTVTAPSTTALATFAAGQTFTIDVDQVGSSTAGANAIIAISYVGTTDAGPQTVVA